MTVGILSDTHLQTISDPFKRQCLEAFSDCSVIIHAGDLIDSAILSSFAGRDVHAVCGNMCNRLTQHLLPKEKHILLEGYSIAITHGTGPRYNIEERVFEQFPDVDCIIFGHSHQPTCQRWGSTLLINPGSFQGTGRYGAGGTYGILTIDNDGLCATIHSLPQLS